MYISCYVCIYRELLSPQQHYDWGLRALKTVLRGCGSLLQAERTNNNNQKGNYNVHVRTYVHMDSAYT